MKYSTYRNGILLSDILDFDLRHIFDCGQCFRWIQEDDGSYTGVVHHIVVNVSKISDGFYFDNCTYNDFEKILIPYFDLSRDYSKIKSRICKDDIIKCATVFGAGIRILKQDLWEMIISFIISQRNSIPKIKKVVSLLCEKFGDEIVYNSKKYYTFPSYSVLANLEIYDLEFLRCGYRDKYIIDAAKKVNEGIVNLNVLPTLSFTEATQNLKIIAGIGDKVALCILLFSLQKFDAFPIDTWMIKVMTERYNIVQSQIPSFASQYFSDCSGFAQQYLFYCEREKGFSA